MQTEEILESKFDTKVLHTDARGRVLKVNDYRMHHENGTALFERPVNSGNLFHENGEPAGRVEVTLAEKRGRSIIVGKKFLPDAEHKAYTAPISGAELLVKENEDLKKQNAAIIAELAALKAESEAKQAAKTQTQQVQAKPAQAAVAVKEG